MPAKNSRKQYIENGLYHVYNRGVEKRTIFLDSQDYNVFLKYLREYLTFKDEMGLKEKLTDSSLKYVEKEKILALLKLNNFHKQIYLLAFCLMPNHFHFFIKQNQAEMLDKFMNSLFTRYSMYFNRKYKRVGPLFQGVYKAVLVTQEEYYLYLTKYIHKQALGTKGEAFREIQPSSYPEYIGKRQTDWVFPHEILKSFSKNGINSYQKFVEASEELLLPGNFILGDIN